MDWDSARRLTQRGIKQAKRGNLREAIESYDQAIQAADHLPALMNRACAYYHLGDLRSAVRDSSWALEVDEVRAPMWLLRGLARADLGQVEQAGHDLTRYLDLSKSVTYRRLAEQTLRKLAS